jgi:hypothetical protein
MKSGPRTYYGRIPESCRGCLNSVPGHNDSPVRCSPITLWSLSEATPLESCGGGTEVVAEEPFTCA